MRCVSTLRRAVSHPGSASGMNALKGVQVRALFAIARLMLLTFLTVTASLACPNEPIPKAGPAQFVQIAPEEIKQAMFSKRAATSAGLGLLSTCCARGTGHCSGAGCGGGCCAACHSAVIVSGWVGPHTLSLRFDFLWAQAAPSSAELEAQFRPPRTFL